ncbi:MFS transporter [Nocardioides sp. BP30]|uniref:MFS transporter n=1 Tax=Nocardioides sp. BP30 TaxID=3036374 RepID=UPI0024686AD3|nr:MFS transporter [Nocardioides sp. BP30]WGL53583.1 MFS transporter [Nocardioides sp. BP30]
MNRRPSPLILAGIVLLALNLRPAAASVGPMLPEIVRGMHLTHSQASLLVALPALAFACLSAVGPALARRFGLHRATLLSVFAIAIGLFARPLADHTWVFLALSVLALGGMAAASVLLPTLVMLHFPERLGTLAAPYSRLLAVGFGAAAVFTVPIAHSDGGWRTGLAFWGALAVVAAIPWLGLIRHDSVLAPIPRTITLPQMIRTRSCRRLAALYALQLLQIWTAMGWFPSLWREHGFHASSAGVLLGVLAVCGLPFTLWWPAVVSVHRDPRRLQLLVGVCYPLGIALLLIAPRAAAVPAAVLLGIAAISFPMSLTLVARHAHSRDAALSLAGVAQTVGYLVAGVGTFGFGLLHLQLGSWGWPLALLLVLALPIPVLAARASIPASVEEQLSSPVAA